MNKEVYYLVLENIHVIIGKEQFNFWRSEIYTKDEFKDAAGKGFLEKLLKEKKCELFNSDKV